MAENKTRPGKENVGDYLKTFGEPVQEDCKILIDMMKKTTGKEPVLWGGNMVGFGSCHYKYESGHEGDIFLVGFAPRKTNITLYLMPGLEPHRKLLAKLGKHKAAKSCLYIKKLKDIDTEVLESVIRDAHQLMLNSKMFSIT